MIAQRYEILGFSNVMSMIMETLDSLESNPFYANIILNVPRREELPYLTESVNVVITDFTHQEINLEKKQVILGVSSPKIKRAVVKYFAEKAGVKGKHFVNIFHPDSVVASTVKVGRGVFINPLTVIAPYAELGNWVSINRKCSIGHHTKIGDYCSINPGVDIGGRCTIGKGTTIGLGVKIIDGIRIGENTIIGAGAIVTKDIPANVVAYGSPAKVIRQND